MAEEFQLVLSLPPFDYFGLESFIKKSTIKYIPLKEALLNIIRSSCNTLHISSPFLEINTVPEIREELLNKAKNVKIKILVRQINGKKTSIRKKNILLFLKEAEKRDVMKNIEIRDYHYSQEPYVNSSVHAKFIIADGINMYIGSGEIRKNSIEKNFEAGIIQSGSEVKNLDKIFLELFSKSRAIR